MKVHVLCVAAVFLAATLVSTKVVAGEIVGTVRIEGTPPPEAEYTPLEDDPTCGKLHKGKVFTQFYRVGPDHGLADVVVMLKGVKAESTGASAPPAELDQKGCLYTPQILAIQTNQKLIIKNSDPVLHNVHMNPTVPANEAANAGKINLAQIPDGPAVTVSFPAPENFLKFQCDVHRWMFAWVTVVDNPYYAVTGEDGSFKIGNVPPGKYTIAALHRKLAPAGVDKEIEVKEGEPTKVDFTLQVK
jgi:Carboxypeptidase regulatory-like domain